MRRAVKRPTDEAAGTQRLARPDFPSLGRYRAVPCLRSSTLEAAGHREPRGRGWPTRRKRERWDATRGDQGGFISPINFVDSGWRKNWVKSRCRISSIFSLIPIIPLWRKDQEGVNLCVYVCTRARVSPAFFFYLGTCRNLTL